MKIIDCRNAKWDDPEQFTFTCEILTTAFKDEWLPFTYNPNDKVEHVVEFFSEWLTDNAETIQEVDLAYYEQKQLTLQTYNVLQERNLLLSESDYIVLPDVWSGLSPTEQAEWAKYRQDLRDLTDQAGFPYEVVWPVKPIKQ